MNERAIFEAALEMTDPQARLGFLRKVFADDPAGLARVEALLESHHQAGSFLEAPLFACTDESSTDKTRVFTEATAGHADVPPPDLSFLRPPSSQPGSLGMLGHYDVLQLLGAGGFGIVFKAFDEKLHRMVAIKVLSPQLATTSPPRKRFLREARAVAAIKHENIVQVYSVEEQPLPYIVMEYVDGDTLQQRLEGSGPLDVGEILNLGQQIASGLAAAHAQGLIHRDIKPGNILIERGIEEKVKITDFGLARAADDASLTASGTICGTPMYMAPEQVLGHTLDARADLFSLGSVLYQMCCGRPPFRAPSTIAVLKRVCDDTPRPIREILPTVPTWLEALIARLHAKKPTDRFSTAKEVADLLGQSLGHIKNPVAQPLPTAIATLGTAPAAAQVAPPKNPARSGRWVNLLWLLAIAVVPSLTAWYLNSQWSHWFNPPPPALPFVATNGLSFDGKDDYLKVENLDWSYPQFTLEAFVTSAADGDNGMIALLSNDASPPEVLYMYDGHPNGDKRVSGGGVEGSKKGSSVISPLRAGQREHRAITFDGTVLYYFVNGQWRGKRYNAAQEGLQWNMRALWIGCRPNETMFFRGSIDQIRVSRVARYTDTFTPAAGFENDDKTLALYTLEEGAGEQLVDHSGNGKHGTIHGATWLSIASTPTQPRVATALVTGQADRSVAEFVLSLPEPRHVHVAVGNGSPKRIDRVADLPNEKFQLQEISISSAANDNFGDSQLARLGQAPHLRILDFGGPAGDTDRVTSISSDGLIAFCQAPAAKSLIQLNLRIDLPRVSDEVIPAVNRCSHLKAILLNGTGITNVGLQELHLPEVEQLVLVRNSNISAVGLSRPIERSPQLRTLHLGGTPLAATDLAPLSRIPKLFQLNIGFSGLTDADAIVLGQLNTVEQLLLQHSPEIHDEGLAHLCRIPSLDFLDLSGSSITDAGCDIVAIRKPNLSHLLIAQTNITDLGLVSLAHLNELETLSLRNCPNITAAGVAKLRAALPKCEINSDFPPSLTVFDRMSDPSGQWSVPENLGPAINSERREASPSLTDDELLLVFSRDGVLYEARRSDRMQPFAPAQRLAGPFTEQPAAETTCSLTGDGLLLATISGTIGERGEDIYLTQRSSRDGPFGPAIKLPAPVNTPGIERHPTLSPDGLQLAITVSRPGLPRGTVLLFERPSRDADFLESPLDLALQTAWNVINSFAHDGRGLLRTTMDNGQETITWHRRPLPTGPYSPGVPLQAPFDHTPCGQPFLSADGQSLYFHNRTLTGGAGNLDLWVVRRLAAKPPAGNGPDRPASNSAQSQ